MSSVTWIIRGHFGEGIGEYDGRPAKHDMLEVAAGGMLMNVRQTLRFRGDSDGTSAGSRGILFGVGIGEYDV